MGRLAVAILERDLVIWGGEGEGGEDGGRLKGEGREGGVQYL